MLKSLAADFIVLFHLLFILFVALGGLLVLRWPKLAWWHVPAAVWGVLIEFCGWICPLTPLENNLRRAGGSNPYSGDFIDNYIMPVIYPAGLTREWQWLLGSAVLVLNAIIYGAWAVLRARHRASRSGEV